MPGWPAFACWTASIASVRMVSIDRCSMSLFATKHLVESLLPFPRRTICVCPVLAGTEHVPDRRRVRPRGRAARATATAAPRSDASSTPEATTGRASASAMIWIQAGSCRRPPPVATISLDVRQQVGDRGEAERDALERRLAEVERRRREGEPGDDALRLGVPAGRALAAEEREEREPVVAGAAPGERRPARARASARATRRGCRRRRARRPRSPAARRAGRGRAPASAAGARSRRARAARPRCRP